MTGSVYIGLLHDTRDWRRHENGMKNGNRFEQPSRCKGGRHDDNRSTSKRKTRRRGTRRRRCSSPQYSGRGPPIGSYRDPHLGIFHQSWRWVMLLKFFWSRVFSWFIVKWCTHRLRMPTTFSQLYRRLSSSWLRYRLLIDLFYCPYQIQIKNGNLMKVVWKCYICNNNYYL